MQNIILTALLALLSRIDFAAALGALYTRAVREIPQPVLDRIDHLVRVVDGLDLPGEAKMKEVIAMLKAPDSPVRAFMGAVQGHLVRWAIETAVARLKARG